MITKRNISKQRCFLSDSCITEVCLEKQKFYGSKFRNPSLQEKFRKKIRNTGPSKSRNSSKHHFVILDQKLEKKLSHFKTIQGIKSDQNTTARHGLCIQDEKSAENLKKKTFLLEQSAVSSLKRNDIFKSSTFYHSWLVVVDTGFPQFREKFMLKAPQLLSKSFEWP